MAETDFIDWIKQNGGQVSDKIAFQNFEEMGRGMVALEDLPLETAIFSIPRKILLSTRTSSLVGKIPEKSWKSLGGWTPLILCILYEYFESPSKLWIPYFNLLPNPGSFNTLMFWEPESELIELTGSTILEKIGKKDADEEYHQVVVPFLKKHKDVFGEVDRYTIERFHWAGSLVLSRSFHVEAWKPEEEESASDSDEEDESEQVEDISLVPLADHLNAKSGASNVKLFYEPEQLIMQVTKPIVKGTQIFNTYADPPNSDLLRRYGHVDVPNENDVAEISMELIAKTIGLCKPKELEKRIDWLLDEGIDDTFSFSKEELLPKEFLIACKVLSYSPGSAELKQLMKKEKLPKVKTIEMDLAEKLWDIVWARVLEYPSSIEDDHHISTVLNNKPIEQKLPSYIDAKAVAPSNKSRTSMSIIVRTGEKEILRDILKKLQQLINRKDLDLVSEEQARRETLNFEAVLWGFKNRKRAGEELPDDTKRKRTE